MNTFLEICGVALFVIVIVTTLIMGNGEGSLYKATGDFGSKVVKQIDSIATDGGK